jgi:hypothetical protein
MTPSISFPKPKNLIKNPSDPQQPQQQKVNPEPNNPQLNPSNSYPVQSCPANLQQPRKNTTAIAKCESMKKNAALNANSSYETPSTTLGPYSDITPNTKAIYGCKYISKTTNETLFYATQPITLGEHFMDKDIEQLNRRFDKLLDSREATQAFERLRVKMEADFMKKTHDDYKTKDENEESSKESSEDSDEERDNVMMFFDNTDNRVSHKEMLKRYKQIFKSPEYRTAMNSLINSKQ